MPWDRHAHPLPVVAVIASYGVIARVVLELPFYPTGRVLVADLLITVVALARQFLAIGDQRALAGAYRALATTDMLTGLATRRHFIETAERLMARYPGRCALVLVDIDHFKMVNDLHGHRARDDALVSVAGHLRSATRPTHLLGRYGGDEMVVLLVDVDVEAAATIVGRSLPSNNEAIPEPDVPLSLSLGWVHGTGRLKDLTHAADTALYAAKSAGRARACGGSMVL